MDSGDGNCYQTVNVDLYLLDTAYLRFLQKTRRRAFLRLNKVLS